MSATRMKELMLQGSHVDEICKPHIKQKKLDSKRHPRHLFVYVKFEKKQN